MIYLDFLKLPFSQKGRKNHVKSGVVSGEKWDLRVAMGKVEGSLGSNMSWDDDEPQDFEWRDEEEEEIPGDGRPTLSRLQRVAAVILLSLVGLYIGSMLLRLIQALLGMRV